MRALVSLLLFACFSHAALFFVVAATAATQREVTEATVLAIVFALLGAFVLTFVDDTAPRASR